MPNPATQDSPGIIVLLTNDLVGLEVMRAIAERMECRFEVVAASERFSEALGQLPMQGALVVDMAIPLEYLAEEIKSCQAKGWQLVVELPIDQSEQMHQREIERVLRYLGTGCSFVTRPILAEELAELRASAIPSENMSENIYNLSEREIQVLKLAAEGMSNKEIGAVLAISPMTVKSHFSRIGRKMLTGDRVEMIAKAMRAGFLK